MLLPLRIGSSETALDAKRPRKRLRLRSLPIRSGQYEHWTAEPAGEIFAGSEPDRCGAELLFCRVPVKPDFHGAGAAVVPGVVWD